MKQEWRARVSELSQLGVDVFLKQKAIDGTSTATYSELYRAVGLPPPDLLHTEDPGFADAFMGSVLHYCRSNQLPPLDALVVTRHDGEPGEGYYKEWARITKRSLRTQTERSDFWHVQVQECFDWGQEQRRARRRRP